MRLAGAADAAGWLLLLVFVFVFSGFGVVWQLLGKMHANKQLDPKEVLCCAQSDAAICCRLHC